MPSIARVAAGAFGFLSSATPLTAPTDTEHRASLRRCPLSQADKPRQTICPRGPRHARGLHRGGQRCGLVSVGFASREFLSWSLISRQVKSSVYVGEKVSDFTQPMRSAAGNVDQFLVISSRVRCSLARHLVTLSLGVWPNAIEPAARQLWVTSQLGMLSATAARVRRAEASVG
jgi:hypothetical protein